MTNACMRLLMCLLLEVAGLGLQQDPAGPEYRLRVRADLVELMVTVKRGNRLITGLEMDDFEVFENGRLQQLAFLERTEEPLRVGLLLDSSGSMTESMQDLQRAAIEFIGNLRPEDRVAVVAFGGSVRKLTTLSDAKSDAIQSIIRLRADGNTRLYDAVVDSLFLLERVHGRTAIVLFTDGEDTASQIAPEALLKRLGRSAIPLFVLGTGKALDRHNRQRLKELSEKTGGAPYFEKKGKDFATAFASISEILRTSYRAGYYLTSPLDGKWRRISARLKSGKAKVVTRPGFYAN